MIPQTSRNPEASVSPAAAPELDRVILKQRALALGRKLATESEARNFLEIVEFDLASERYAFPIEQVREVSQLRELTPVPCTPEFVLGIINLRGEILTVIDLKRFFDLPSTEITELHKVLVLRWDNMQIGILADAIRGVKRLSPEALQPALPTLTGVRADYLHGITSDRLVVLDAAKILSDKRLLVDDDLPT